MRSTEFIKEAGRGQTDDFGQPINQPPTDAEYAARQAQGAKTGAAIKNFFSSTPKELKDAPPGTPIDPYVRARLGYKPYAGETQPGVLVDRNGNPVRDGSGQPIQTPNSPVAKPADVTLPQNQRTLVDPRSLDQAVPAPVAPAPAPAPAPVQKADPVPSFNVPGAAQAGQGGTNYTTGVAQDRPNANDAGVDQTTRNDYPFVPYTGPEPKPTVKPKPNPNPTPVPTPVNQRGAITKGPTPLLGPNGRTPVPALANKTVGPEFKPYPQAKTLPTPQAKTLPTGNSPTPAASSVVIKPGDTLSRIAAANGTTVQAIMAANPSIRDANRIAAGQTVKLRESSEVARIRHLAGLTRN